MDLFMENKRQAYTPREPYVLIYLAWLHTSVLHVYTSYLCLRHTPPWSMISHFPSARRQTGMCCIPSTHCQEHQVPDR